jgi:hypothetical protein
LSGFKELKMTRITADDVLRRKLLNFAQVVEICDESGYVLARVQACTPSNGAARIAADDELRKRLLNFDQDIEISDESGNVLARVDACAPWSHPDQWEPVEPPSPEEVQRSLHSGGRTYTTAEVLEMLKRL